MISPRGQALWKQLTAADWLRIQAMCRSLSRTFGPAALEDLSVPLRVGCCLAGDEWHYSGERMGLTKDGKIQILVWEMSDRETREWRERRSA